MELDLMMNRLGGEENKRKTMRKHEEKQENQESTELKKPRARRSSRNSLAIVRLFTESGKNEHHKRCFYVITGDVHGYLECVRQLSILLQQLAATL